MTMTVRITVGPDHRISGTAPESMPPGEHVARIEVDAALTAGTGVIDNLDWFPSHDFGPWPEGLTFSREEMYGDDGRLYGNDP